MIFIVRDRKSIFLSLEEIFPKKARAISIITIPKGPRSLARAGRSSIFNPSAVEIWNFEWRNLNNLKSAS